MTPRVQKIIVGIAVAISAISFGYVVYWLIYATHGTEPMRFEAVSELSDDGNARVDRIANTINHLDALSSDDARFLVESVNESDEVVVRRWALAVMAEHLGKKTEMSEQTRAVLENTIIAELSSTNHRMAICAIGGVEEADDGPLATP